MKAKTIFYFIIILSSTACSIHKGYINSSVSIQSANFRIVKPVSGTSSATYFLGIGGVNTNGLILEAKDDMYQNAHLKSNQALANIAVDEKYSFFIIPIYFKHTVLLSADLIEFSVADENQKFLNNDTVENSTSKSTKTTELQNYSSANPGDPQTIKVGSSVKFSDMFGIKYTGVITKVDKGTVEVEYDSGLGGYKKTVIKIKDILKE